MRVIIRAFHSGWPGWDVRAALGRAGRLADVRAAREGETLKFLSW